MNPQKPSWFGSLGLTLIALVWLFPYAWMVLTSLKTLPELVAAPTSLLPNHLDFSAYRSVLGTMPLAHYLWTPR